jgi:hypothetical protein
LLKLPDGRILFPDAGPVGSWYDSSSGKDLLASTHEGRAMFLWEAKYDSGETVRQFEEVVFTRAITDYSYVPPEETRISVDSLDKSKIVQFSLYPTAITRILAPWFSQPIVVNIHPESGERLVNFWVVDEQHNPDRKLYRTVVGIETGDSKILTVICPSGKIVVTKNEDLSYEGE